jgi:thymidylate synthase
VQITTVIARDLNEAWWKLLRECLDHGYEYTITKGSHNEGKTRKEFDCAVIQITHPGNRPLSPTVPEGVPVPCTDAYIEKDYMSYLLTAGKKEKEEYTYGEYLESQYLKCIEMWQEAGEFTNQACMTVGDMHSIDLPDPPCLRVVDTRVRYGKLHWFVYFRSWDLWGGFPANMGGIQIAKEMMAQAIGVEDGELFAFSKGLHLYGEYIDAAKLACGYNK